MLLLIERSGVEQEAEWKVRTLIITIIGKHTFTCGPPLALGWPPFNVGSKIELYVVARRFGLRKVALIWWWTTRDWFGNGNLRAQLVLIGPPQGPRRRSHQINNIIATCRSQSRLLFILLERLFMPTLPANWKRKLNQQTCLMEQRHETIPERDSSAAWARRWNVFWGRFCFYCLWAKRKFIVLYYCNTDWKKFSCCCLNPVK